MALSVTTFDYFWFIRPFQIGYYLMVRLNNDSGGGGGGGGGGRLNSYIYLTPWRK
jgi:hypothetical protein